MLMEEKEDLKDFIKSLKMTPKEIKERKRLLIEMEIYWSNRKRWKSGN